MKSDGFQRWTDDARKCCGFRRFHVIEADADAFVIDVEVKDVANCNGFHMFHEQEFWWWCHKKLRSESDSHYAAHRKAVKRGQCV